MVSQGLKYGLIATQPHAYLGLKAVSMVRKGLKHH